MTSSQQKHLSSLLAKANKAASKVSRLVVQLEEAQAEYVHAHTVANAYIARVSQERAEREARDANDIAIAARLDPLAYNCK
jgi:hypothetical protein